MRVGVNTGPVLLGTVGTTAEYTAMGDTVNLASRLEHAAPVGGVLISHDTYRHVRGLFDVQALEPLAVKGKAEPVQAYLVLRARPRAFRVPTRGVEGIETRTIGRQAELGQLQRLSAIAAAERQVHVALVVGEAGVGKSRLLYEFGNWLDLLPPERQVALFKGRATQAMARLPFALLRDMLTLRFGIQESDRAASAREKLEQAVADLLGPASREQAHFIGHLIGLDFAGSPFLEGIRSDARQIRDRAFHAIAELFAAVAAQQPLVILLEDIHWADDSSLDLVDYLAREPLNLPLTVVCPTRPTLFERRPAWQAEQARRIQIDVRPLAEDDTRALVHEILRKLPVVPAELLDLIVRRADGSPFFVEELIKMLIDDGVIVTADESWRVEPGRLAGLRVPPTLTGILQARLDGLPSAERAALQRASVVGRVFWSHAVEQLAATGADAPAQEQLGTLWHKELIFRREPSAFVETDEYIFKHAILRDVTYESVLKRVRRDYHAQVAAWLSERSQERAGEYAGLIGEHFELAGAGAHAAEWYLRAGRQARDTFAPEVAIGYFQKALALWDAAPADVPAQLRLAAYEGLGEMLHWQARYAESAAAYESLRACAEQAGDMVVQARAWNGVALAVGFQGDHQAALAGAQCAERLARRAAAHLELATALWRQGWARYRLGNAEAALALSEQVYALRDLVSDRREIARSMNLAGSVHAMLGRYDQSERAFEQALAILQDAGDHRGATSVLNNLGELARLRGGYRLAVARYHEALAIARRLGDRDGEMAYLSNLGGARVGLAEHAAAVADLQQVIAMAGSAGWSNLSETYRFLASAYLAQGQTPGALEAAQRALDLGMSAGAQEYLAAAWRVLGLIAAQLGAPVEAGGRQADAPACFAESARICAETGMEGEQAHTLRDWASYLLARGQRGPGLDMWQQARALFEQLGAALEVERMDQARW
jgi:tetratricopeptide (TPR) repeat protein